ncbi:hypothetical protein H7F33_10695 [Pedobacter sp. PAMC26386]|nr:hypothetical protein H7F33_10695 [Pedobacter sp. PAMC26386]
MVEQTSEIVMSSLVIKTVTEFRWDVRVLKVSDEYYHIELLSLDNVLKETNNPNMRDLNAFNNAFKRMYSELNMIINRQGELIKLNNIEEIQRKWAQVKTEMEAVQTKHDNMKGLIALNDDLFNNVENITEAVKGNEFFEVFLNVFMGVNLPGSKKLKKKSLFAQESIHWEYDINCNPSLPTNNNVVIIDIKGRVSQSLDKSWIKRAYGSFPIAELADRQPVLADSAKYRIDHTSGRLLEGLITKEEAVHEEFLKAKMVYRIVADHPKAEEQEPGESSRQKEEQGNANPRKTSIILD